MIPPVQRKIDWLAVIDYVARALLINDSEPEYCYKYMHMKILIKILIDFSI